MQASFVRFLVSSNWGDSVQTGFAEVQFDNSPTAVPFEVDATLGFLLVGGISAVGYLKRKNQAQRIESQNHNDLT